MKYRIKPGEVEAIQHEGSGRKIKETFPHLALKESVKFGEYISDIEVWQNKTQKWMALPYLYYLVFDGDKFYTMSPSEFNKKYEEVKPVTRG